MGDVVACSGQASDPNGDAVTLSYAWSNGATGSSLTLTSQNAAVDAALTCTASALDARGGQSRAASVQGATVLNSPPVVTSVAILPATPRASNTLTASVQASDPNGTPLSFAYSWSVTNAGGTTTYALESLQGQTQFGSGDTVELTVEVSDGRASAARTASTVTVTNTAPTAPQIALTPEEPLEGEDLVCEVVGASTDADGDAVS